MNPATAPAPARLGVFLSGSGRTLLNLHDAIRDGRLHAAIPLVVASRECLGAEPEAAPPYPADWAGAAAGAAVMLTRNLGLSHAAEEAERAKAAGKSADDKAGA